MDKIKSIFNYEKKDITERDPGLYRWEKKPYVKDDVKVLNNLLHKMLKKNRSDTSRFKDEKHFFGSSLVKSNYKKKENNQRVMFKMSYSNSMRQHNKYIKYYMPQMQKDNVIDKPELFGTTDEEYEKNKVAGHFKFIVSPENQNVNLKVLINDFIKRIEKLSGYELYWQACIHTDTEHPHGHIVINRKDKNGRRIYFPKQMIKNTMREILSESATKLVGPRSKFEIELAKNKMISANRWTDLDKKIESIKGVIYPKALDVPLQNRLAHLSTIGLANYQNNKVILKKDWKEVLMATARYNTYLEEYLKQDNLPLKMYEGGLLQGKVDRVISFDKDESWNDAIIVRTQTHRIYVPVYQLHKQNLEGKTVSVSGGDGGITRQITDRDIKVVNDKRSIGRD